MPTDFDDAQPTTLQELVGALGTYSIDAWQFVQHGVTQTAAKLYGDTTDRSPALHISGQELCCGLRDLALEQWGLLASTVLQRWGVGSTLDFGKIVFAMIDCGLLSKTERDTLDDFRDVFDFADAFDAGYVIAPELFDERRQLA